MQRLLFNRLHCEGFCVPIGWSHYNDSNPLVIDQMVVSNCCARNSSEHIFFGMSERLTLLGNIFENADNSHVSRVGQAYLGVISHNIISGSSLSSDSGRHALKLHGSGSDEYGPLTPDTINLEKETRFAVITDNIFGSSGPWQVCIGPSGENNNCFLTDIIFERNKFFPDYGEQSSRSVQIELLIWASYITIRNNIFDGTGSANSYTGIFIGRRGIEPAPHNNNIYNNIFYRQNDGIASTFQVGIEVDNTAYNISIKDNIAVFPEFEGNTLISNRSSDLTEDNNLLLDSFNFIDPNNSNPLLRDFNS
jgi:hypothetical protein